MKNYKLSHNLVSYSHRTIHKSIREYCIAMTNYFIVSLFKRCNTTIYLLQKNKSA